MTRNEMMNYLMETYGTDEKVKAFVDHERELLENKKASNERRKKAKAEEDRMMAEKIVNILEDINIATATEIGGELGVSPQKATFWLKNLVTDGKVIRSTKGKNTFFTLAK